MCTLHLWCVYIYAASTRSCLTWSACAGFLYCYTMGKMARGVSTSMDFSLRAQGFWQNEIPDRAHDCKISSTGLGKNFLSLSSGLTNTFPEPVDKALSLGRRRRLRRLPFGVLTARVNEKERFSRAPGALAHWETGGRRECSGLVIRRGDRCCHPAQRTLVNRLE
jgi:hypothetical protein